MSIVYNPLVLIEIKRCECFPRTCNFGDEWPCPHLLPEIPVIHSASSCEQIFPNIQDLSYHIKLWAFTWQKTAANFKSDSAWVVITGRNECRRCPCCPTLMNLLMERLNSILIYSFIQIDSANCWFSMFHIYPWNPIKIKPCCLSSAIKTFHRCHPPRSAWHLIAHVQTASTEMPQTAFGRRTAFRICFARVYLTVNYLQPAAPQSHIPDVRVHHFHTWTHWMSTIFPLGWCKFV